MASTYSQMTLAMEEIPAIINQNRNKLQAAKASIDSVDSVLGGLPAQYGAILSDISAGLAAEPNNAALAAMDAHKTALVAEFQALKAEAAAWKAAIEAVA